MEGVKGRRLTLFVCLLSFVNYIIMLLGDCMKCNYTIKKQDLKRYLQQKHRKINLFCIVLFMILFILFNFNVFMNNQKLMMMILGMTLIVIGILIFIVNKLYILASIHHMEKGQMTFGKHVLLIDQDHIEDRIRKHKLSFAWKDVRKIKITEKRISIKPKEGTINLVLEKRMMNPTDFEAVVQEIRKYQ